MDLKEEQQLGEAVYSHWYYISKGKAMQQYLGAIRAPEVLDVGAGSGIFSRQLLDGDFCKSAVCVDPYYDVETEELHNGKPIAFRKRVCAPAQKLVLMMDVLEHVEDDAGLLRQYTAVLPDDAFVLITVPAFPFLWSGHDVFLEHHRRYTANALSATIDAAGLETVKMHYFFAGLFPLAAVLRVAKNALRKRGQGEVRSELKVAPAWLNNILILIHAVERRTIFRINRCAGLTLFCLCRKKTPA